MPHTIADRVAAWDASAQWGPSAEVVHYGAIHDQIDFLHHHRFYQYEPALGSHPNFDTRLRDWLNSAVADDDQRILFRLVPRLFFVGIGEFYAMYRDALRRVVHDWLLEEMDVDLESRTAARDLGRALKRTWFCPITDSMQIAAFHHINGLSGAKYRPDWYSLAKFGDTRLIASHMRTEGFDRIVLLEDFVGSGSQIEGAIRFAAALAPNPRVLVVPLLVCPAGSRMGRLLEAELSNVQYSPILDLPSRAFVSGRAKPDEDELLAALRELCLRLEPLIRGTSRRPYYSALGYKSTGGLVVMYTNCPDNTVPIIHHESESWKPVFPRSSRL
jgi:hypothetical protein